MRLSDNMELLQGRDHNLKIVFDYKNTDPVTGLVTYPVFPLPAGTKVYLTIKKHIDDLDDAAILKKEITVLPGSENGPHFIAISKNDCLNINGVFTYDLAMKFTDNTVIGTRSGTVKFVKRVTHETP